MTASEPQARIARQIEQIRSKQAQVQTPRFAEVLFAASTLILVAPIMVLAAIAIKLDSRGPVFFRQERTGLGGRTFRIIKFRTMTVCEDGENVIQAKRDDDRITRVGAWLRRMSVDELPQFINILKGDMAVVGPRPHAVAHDVFYSRSISNYVHRQAIKPGITGWAQVNGLRGETPDIAAMAERVSYDIWYSENRSFALDAQIGLKTIGVVLRQINAH